MGALGSCAFFYYVFGGEYYFFSSTFFRIKGNASSVFRVSRLLHEVKYGFYLWVIAIVCGDDVFLIHCLGRNGLSAGGGFYKKLVHSFGVDVATRCCTYSASSYTSGS